MPAYNASRTIVPAIQSLLAQTRTDFELIVIDDGSTDATADVVRPLMGDGRITLVQQENRGVTAAYNAGFSRARGRYASILDSDDLWMPTYLEAMGAALDRSSDAGLAYTDAWVLDDASRKIRRASAMAYQRPPESPPADAHAFLRLLIQRNFIYTSATIRRAVLDDVGLLNERLHANEEYELWLRIVAHGYRAVRAPGLLAIYRRSPGTLSTDLELMASNARELYRIVAEEYDVPEDVREIARTRLEEVDRLARAVTGSDRIGAARFRARRLASRLRQRALRRRLWYDTPPDEVNAAFPDLQAV